MNLVYPLKYNKTFIRPLNFNVTLTYPLKGVNIVLTGDYSLTQTVDLEIKKDCEIGLNEDFSKFFECKLGISEAFTV